jgi:pimeloyl-ACP methyl ester carboxylesterase
MMNRIEIKARGLTFDGWADGPEEGPLLLLLHGLPRTSWEWHHQLPKLAKVGYRAVAFDMRGYCPGARPEGVEAYVVDEFAKDVLAIATEFGWADRPFHLMGTSIGAVVAWRVATEYPQRVATLACINIPHPGAFAEVLATKAADNQREKMSYITNSRKEGNELKMLNFTLETMDLPDEETDPYLEALSSDEALSAVYHFYRANVPGPDAPAVAKTPPLKPVVMPTMFIWPPGAGNVSQETAEANARYVEGPYRFEILEGARNFALQKEPEKITQLLLEHLAEHAQ